MAISHQKAAEIFESHPMRFTKKEKAALRATLRDEFTRMGYTDGELTEVQASGTNFVAGAPHTAEYLFTAHYDTPGRTGWMLWTARLFGQTGANLVLIVVMVLLMVLAPMLSEQAFSLLGNEAAFWSMEACALLMLLIMIGSMVFKNPNNRNDNTSGVLSLLALADAMAGDEELRGKCCFVFFDNEEWGLLGSSGFASWGKKQGIDWKKVKMINFDCVGYGDVLTFASTKKTAVAEALAAACQEAGMNPVRKHSKMVFLSDHANFPNSVMVSYTLHSACGPLYLPLIHTSKDTVCDVDQINALTDRVYGFVKQAKI